MIRALCPCPALDVTHLVDAVRPQGITRPREVIRLAGGKGLNLARAAATLGGDVEVIAPLGGRIGQLVAELAAADGIALHRVSVSAPTRMCVSAIPDDGAPTELYEPAAPLTRAEAEALRAAVPADGAGRLALCGRIPDELPVSALVVVLERARCSGAAVVVDSSGPQLAVLLAAFSPDVVKVNRDEAAELVGALGHGGRHDAAGLAAQVHELTGRSAVVTDGAAGAVAVGADGAWRAEPDPVRGRFGIGSGDSFLAGLLVAAEAGETLPRMLALASAAGSANARRPGAGRLTAADVDAAARRIRVVSV